MKLIKEKGGKQRKTVKVLSDYRFFEVFLQKNKRSFELWIPQTILLAEGQVKAWLFNSKKLQTPEILLKNSKNLTFSAIMKEFLHDSDEEALKALYLSANLSIKYEPIAFIEFWPEKSQKIKEIVDKNRLLQVLQEKNSIKMIQSLIKSHKTVKNSSNSCFFCEARKTEEKTCFFFSKKFFIYENSNENPLCEDYLTENSRKILKKYEKKGEKREIITKSLDCSLNNKMENTMKKFIEMFRNPGFFLEKIVMKFIVNDQENPVFKGITEVFVEFRGRISGVFEEKEIEFEAFNELIEGKKKKIKDFSIRKLKGEFKGIYSKNLREKLQEEHCEGDFCEFIGVKKLRGGLEELPYSKYLTEEQRANFNRNKELLFDNYSPKQPFQISSLLMKKIFENKAFIDKILKESGLIHKNTILGKDGLFSDETLGDFTMNFKEKHCFNKKNLIKIVKICSNCYYIYNFLRKKLEDFERNKEKNMENSTWIHREKRFSNTFNESLKISHENHMFRHFSNQNTVISIEKPQTSAVNYRKFIEINQNSIEKTELLSKKQSFHNENARKNYSFLNKQDLSTHVLNLGFSSSFRMNFDLLKEEENRDYSNDKNERETLEKHVNFYEISDRNAEIQSSFLNKKKHFAENLMGSHEISRKSSSDVLKMLNSPISGTSLKQKRDSIQLVITTRLPSYLQNSLLNKKGDFKSSDLSSRCTALYHRNLKLLRNLPSFRISTPKLSFIDGQNPFHESKERNPVDFYQLLALIHQEPPKINKEILDNVKVFICDETTAIPYLVLDTRRFFKGKKNDRIDEKSNEKIDEKFNGKIDEKSNENLSEKSNEKSNKKSNEKLNEKSNEKSNGKSNEKSNFSFIREVLIVCHDFFENFFEKIDFYLSFSSSNDFIIVLFNYPGQAFTFFDIKRTYNNEYNSRLLDLLLFELQKNEIFFLRSDNFRFLGFGNGGNLACSFLCLNDNSVINFKYLLLFNTFLYIDDILSDALQKSIEVFEKLPIENPELAFIYEETLNKQLRKPLDFIEISRKFVKNPITIQGRIAILSGVLENINIAQNVKNLRFPIRIAHSQQNPLINVTHLDLLLISTNNKEQLGKNVEFYQNIKGNLGDFFTNFSLRKALILDKGGYNLFEDYKAIIAEIVEEFLSVFLKRNLTQKIAYIDRKIAIIEKKIVNFFLIYVEKLIEFTENPFEDVLAEALEKIQMLFNIYQPKYKRISNENRLIQEELDEIYEEYRNCKKKISRNNEEFDEFQERNEKTLNIQTKKFADLKNNMTRIMQEFLSPFRIAMKSLLYFKLLLDVENFVGKAVENQKFIRETLMKNDNFNEEKCDNFNEENVEKSLMKNEKIRAFDVNEDKKSLIKTALMKKKLSLDLYINDIKEPKAGNQKKNEQNCLFARSQITLGFHSIFQKLFYCRREKEEAYEAFSFEIEGFEKLELRVLKKIKDFYREFFENEKGFIEKMKEKSMNLGFIKEFFEYFKAIFQGFYGFCEGYSGEMYENLLLEEEIVVESQEFIRNSEEIEDSPLVTESNFSEKSMNNVENYVNNMNNMKNFKEKMKKYKEFKKENKEFGKEFKGFYEEILGRNAEKDVEELVEMEKIIEGFEDAAF